MVDLDQLIEQANDLAPLPVSTVRLAALVGNHDCDIEAIIEIVSFDQVLTAKLLRGAKSCADRRATPIRSAREAEGTRRSLRRSPFRVWRR